MDRRAAVGVRPRRMRLFCFAHAGGGTSFYRPWRAALAPGVDAAPVLLPGRETRFRETPYRRMEELIPPLCAALAPQLDRPYALFGHSMGAIVAFETARWFSARGAGPACLIVSGRPAPRVANPRRRFCALPDEQFLAARGRAGRHAARRAGRTAAAQHADGRPARPTSN